MGYENLENKIDCGEVVSTLLYSTYRDIKTPRDAYLLLRFWELEYGESFISNHGRIVSPLELCEWLLLKGYMTNRQYDSFLSTGEKSSICYILDGYDEDYTILPYHEELEMGYFKVIEIFAEFLVTKDSYKKALFEAVNGGKQVKLTGVPEPNGSVNDTIVDEWSTISKYSLKEIIGCIVKCLDYNSLGNDDIEDINSHIVYEDLQLKLK